MSSIFVCSLVKIGSIIIALQRAADRQTDARQTRDKKRGNLPQYCSQFLLGTLKKGGGEQERKVKIEGLILSLCADVSLFFISLRRRDNNQELEMMCTREAYNTGLKSPSPLCRIPKPSGR